MFTAAELAEHRADARSRMTSRVTIRRKSIGGDRDRTGRRPEQWTVVDTDVPARIKPRGSRAGRVGDVRTELATAEVHLPWDHADLADGDYVEVTSGEWPGAAFRVVEAVRGDQQTARRVPVEETGREWPAEEVESP